MAKRYLYIR